MVAQPYEVLFNAITAMTKVTCKNQAAINKALLKADPMTYKGPTRCDEPWCVAQRALKEAFAQVHGP